MASERNVGGLWCSEVLQRLSDYVDGELSTQERAGVETHLQGCNWCARFGGDFAGMVAELSRSLDRAEPLSSDPASRLHQRLDADLDDGSEDETEG